MLWSEELEKFRSLELVLEDPGAKLSPPWPVCSQCFALLPGPKFFGKASGHLECLLGVLQPCARGEGQHAGTKHVHCDTALTAGKSATKFKPQMLNFQGPKQHLYLTVLELDIYIQHIYIYNAI